MMRYALALLLISLTVAASLTAVPPAVSIKEWDVPTPRSRPHDPALAPDGSLWYTGQMANKLGRLDPKTGQFKEYPLKTPDSGPHGLVADRDGNIWFTAIFKGYVGRLDPRTGDITEYHMTDPRVRDPHPPALDPQGNVWFTTEQSNFIGRLDPKSGEIKVKEVPTPPSVPYGIVVTAKGVPYFCEFGANKLASVDPRTMEITEYAMPEGARPRRLALAADGSIYYSDYARGYLGHFDPATRKVEEWPSSGGPASKPYGIAVVPNGMVWYSESGVSPNTLVQFDPRSKTFSSTVIPSGGGVVRNMVATGDGRLYLACSGSTKSPSPRYAEQSSRFARAATDAAWTEADPVWGALPQTSAASVRNSFTNVVPAGLILNTITFTENNPTNGTLTCTYTPTGGLTIPCPAGAIGSSWSNHPSVRRAWPWRIHKEWGQTATNVDCYNQRNGA
jgi:virginiamycin B lyase